VKRKNRENSDLNKKAIDKNAQSNGIKSMRNQLASIHTYRALPTEQTSVQF
jgi:hypothetical protein